MTVHEEVASEHLPSFESVSGCLLDKNQPLAKRMRAIFYLRTMGGDNAVDALCQSMDDSSELFKHEVAYVLGQMQNPRAVPFLTSVLENTQEASIVRHEAAEALGALGELSSLPVLERFCADPAREVKETCEIAVRRLKWKHGLVTEEEQSTEQDNPYCSVDPAPAPSQWKAMPTSELRRVLLDSSLPLYERYRAMFALRNRGDEEAVLALADGFADDSALFRHEIAYVMGQIQHPASVPSLVKVLTTSEEMGMVRHEAAEALGSIGHPSTLQLLEDYKKDPERVVSESCIVALDIVDYWGSSQA